MWVPTSICGKMPPGNHKKLAAQYIFLQKYIAKKIYFCNIAKKLKSKKVEKSKDRAQGKQTDEN